MSGTWQDGPTERRANGARADFSARLVACGPLIVALLVAPCGCDGPKKPSPGQLSGIASGSAWPYWPVAMRVHPLTRIVKRGEGTSREQVIVEARIEFFDRVNHTSKAIGQIRLEVRGVRSGSGSAKGQQPADTAPDATTQGATETLPDTQPATPIDPSLTPETTEDDVLGWEQDLSILETNRRFYDDVTRAYLFRLEVPADMVAAGGADLRVYFVGTDGSSLQATARVK